MKQSKILFPTDFSKQSINALKETVKLNESLGYELVVFHAYSRPYTETYDNKGKLDKAERDIERDFKTIEEKIPDIKAQKYSFKRQMGDFIDIVEDYVDKESIGLIVMSTKGAVGIGELFGTKTAKLIKSVTVPVIVVPEGCSLAPLGKIGLACDYSQETPKEKTDFLIGLADLMKSELDLITLNRDEKR